MTDPTTAFDEAADQTQTGATAPPDTAPEAAPTVKPKPRARASRAKPAGPVLSARVADAKDVAHLNDAPVKPNRVRIILEENDNIPPTGQFIGINGKGYLLRPGEEVSVPRGVVDVLNDAVEFRPLVESGRVTGYRKALRFPYRVMG